MRLQVALPALAVGRIGEHEIELVGTEGVGGERGSILYVVCLPTLAFQNEVSLADGVSLRVHLLAVQMNRSLLALFPSQLSQSLFRDCQHSACAARAVIDKVGARLDFIGNRQEDEASHELHHVPWGEVLPGFLVVLLVEAAYELFEDRTHAVVVQALQADGAVSVQDGLGTEVD